jgi:hypothetical protein
MELYIPSLLVLTLAVIFIFILSKVSPFILFVLVLITLVLVGFQHANLFTYEYETSTWQNMITGSSNTLIIVAVVLMGVGFIFNLVGRGAAVKPTASSFYPSKPTTALPAYGMNTLRSLVRDPFKSR